MTGRRGTRIGPAALLLAASTAASGAGPLAGTLRVHASNPRYFDDGTGRAIYLTGSHNWNNLQDGGVTDPPPPTDYNAYLDFLTGHGHNFTRGWHWEQARWAPWTTGDEFYQPLPFARTGPGLALDGKPKFDVTQFNQAYFDRLRARVVAAGERGVCMGIMLFEGWSIEKKNNVGNPWPGHPLHRDNNINGLDGDPNGDNQGHEAHTLEVPAITAVQENYIRKVIDTLNDLDHILFEISNESHAGSVPWQYHMIEFIKAYEQTKPKQHLVWMSAAQNSNPYLYNGPADVISPNWRDGTDFKVNPPATTGSKVILLDTDHIWGVGGDLDWPWRAFTRGYQPIYMDPLDEPSDPGSDPEAPMYVRARRAMGHALTYANRMDLAGTIPQSAESALPSSTRFCLYAAGAEYLVFQPSSGVFTVELPEGSYDYEWFDPISGTVAETGQMITFGGFRAFTPPFSGMAVLFIHSAGPAPHPGDLDLDGDVDQTDFGMLQNCISAWSMPTPAGCDLADLDQNNVVDQVDVGMFLNCVGGANQPPGC